MRIWFVASALLLALGASSAQASRLPLPMRDALDAYAYDYATFQGWTYTDRENGRGDYRRAYFTLSFFTTAPTTVCAPGGRRCHAGPAAEIGWTVEARAAKCGPGWYIVSTPLEPRTCTRTDLPAW